MRCSGGREHRRRHHHHHQHDDETARRDGCVRVQQPRSGQRWRVRRRAGHGTRATAFCPTGGGGAEPANGPRRLTSPPPTAPAAAVAGRARVGAAGLGPSGAVSAPRSGTAPAAMMDRLMRQPAGARESDHKQQARHTVSNGLYEAAGKGMLMLAAAACLPARTRDDVDVAPPRRVADDGGRPSRWDLQLLGRCSNKHADACMHASTHAQARQGAHGQRSDTMDEVCSSAEVTARSGRLQPSVQRQRVEALTSAVQDTTGADAVVQVRLVLLVVAVQVERAVPQRARQWPRR